MKWTTRACNGQRHVAGFPWRLSASDESLAISVAGPFVAAADVSVMRAASVSLGSGPDASCQPENVRRGPGSGPPAVGSRSAGVGQLQTLVSRRPTSAIARTADSQSDRAASLCSTRITRRHSSYGWLRLLYTTGVSTCSRVPAPTGRCGDLARYQVLLMSGWMLGSRLTCTPAGLPPARTPGLARPRRPRCSLFLPNWTLAALLAGHFFRSSGSVWRFPSSSPRALDIRGGQRSIEGDVHC
jgi:hypothetical protein